MFTVWSASPACILLTCFVFVCISAAEMLEQIEKDEEYLRVLEARVKVCGTLH